MTREEVEEFASNESLDVRPINEYQYRLMDEWGKYILDVYFKKNKRGEVVKNSVLCWATNKWSVANTTEELKKLIKK